MAKTGSKLTSVNDDVLVRMALDGNQTAFSALHAKYELAVCSIIGKIVSDPIEVEDICIESFERAFQKLCTFDQGKKFSTWLFAIAKNKALDHKTLATNKSKVIDNSSIDMTNDKADNVADGQLSPEEYIISTQDHETFLNCISGLPELYREVAQMCYVDNLGYKEIAEKTNLPLNTVKTRINRARAQIIRKMLEEE